MFFVEGGYDVCILIDPDKVTFSIELDVLKLATMSKTATGWYLGRVPLITKTMRLVGFEQLVG
ncbi:MAG: hypothetical protein DMG70_06305 [Acidobacteria bacterium]|nr:MAG: hypothetical protein DMG70_06305 [Acidobacteriota bacterium]PYY05838.1 MAG: hypothetical protein DMG69_25295 [Acidobacteriota bacterium]